MKILRNVKIRRHKKPRYEHFFGQMPQFRHNCEPCVFLGRYRVHGNDYDLYYCGPPTRARATVIARYGNDPESYSSGLDVARIWAEKGPRHALAVAYTRAKRWGLLS